jgi:N5-methyltetrahydromethanopterin:coenzyme M methyltransferase subunit H
LFLSGDGEVLKMLKFEKEQKVFDIAGVKLGGQPGEYPTVLIGTIFYDKHKIISDEIKGTFDRSKAEDLLKKQEVMSEKTGNPIILDVPGHTSEALTKYVDFVSEKTSSPFLVDCPLTSVRVSVMRHLAEAGLLNRAVYNSIDYTANSEEISALRELAKDPKGDGSLRLQFVPRGVMHVYTAKRGKLRVLRPYRRVGGGVSGVRDDRRSDRLQREATGSETQD